MRIVQYPETKIANREFCLRNLMWIVSEAMTITPATIMKLLVNIALSNCYISDLSNVFIEVSALYFIQQVKMLNSSWVHSLAKESWRKLSLIASVILNSIFLWIYDYHLIRYNWLLCTINPPEVKLVEILPSNNGNQPRIPYKKNLKS